MRRIIQFLHPGGEHGIDQKISASEGYKNWNCGLHKRKFLFADGFVTQHPKVPPTKSTFTFWGEWEPQSRVREIFQTGNGYPKWLHTPELNLDVLRSVKRNEKASCGSPAFQNTDPLVFGDRFRYVLCQQIRKNGRLTTLAKLHPGDIILFGSNVNRMFALDTVFVIDSYEELDNDGKFPGWKSDLHRKITIDLIDIPKCGLKFYGGKTWSLDRPFSFVPCRPATPHANGFGRPLIGPSGILKDVITPKLLQGYKITEFGDNKRADAAWDALVTQVVNQNCYLGTLVDEPTWHA